MGNITYLNDNIRIRNYKPEDIDYIIKIHKDLYSKEYNFSSVFSDYTEKYIRLFDESHSERENIWIAEVNSKPVGVIAVVKYEINSAQIRWFLIEPEMRGKGIGHKLFETAVNFCREKDYVHTFLWTADILKAARHIYKTHGFTLHETFNNTTWSDKIVKEEKWDLYL